MTTHGFLRVAAASPELRVADCRFNAERTLDLLRRAEDAGVDLVVFPELGLTGYTCHDLFHDHTLRRSAAAALETLLSAADLCFGGVAAVGLPVALDGRLFNTAAAMSPAFVTSRRDILAEVAAVLGISRAAAATWLRSADPQAVAELGAHLVGYLELFRHRHIVPPRC